MSTDALNRFLDSLPRTRLPAGLGGGPAYARCGVLGVHAGLAAAGAGLLLRGLSLVTGLVGVLACVASFLAYTRVRRALTGRETLVLQEVTAAALLAGTGAVWAMAEPVLPYLDVAAAAIPAILACGRVGCLLAGCCHGRPAGLGIRYPAAAGERSVSPHLAGVRLFPVQAVEAAGLAAISLTGLAALPFAADGHVLAWFLVSYGVLRFGTEGLRGDARPAFLGLSRGRWGALAGVAVAAWVVERARVAAPGPREAAAAALLAGALAAALGARRHYDGRRRLLAPSHVAELAAMVADGARGIPAEGGVPAVRATSRGVVVGCSADGERLHLSLSLAEEAGEAEWLCALAARALGGVRPAAARLTGGRVLHLPLALPLEPPAGGDEAARRGLALYGAVTRRAQRAAEAARAADAMPAPEEPAAPRVAETPRRAGYFGVTAVARGPRAAD